MDAERKQSRRPRPVYAGLDDPFVGAPGETARPLCLCVTGGVPMYVARHGDGRLVKRMPMSGPEHAPWCPHYGLRSNTKTTGHPSRVRDAGEAPSPSGWRPDSVMPPDRGGPRADAEARPVGLLAVLHELWSTAQLTRWHPGFAGKRHWGIVRRHLLQAARVISTPTGALVRRLYIPEVFNAERADKIRERREARWDGILHQRDFQHSLVLVGELKALRAGPHVARAWLKHLPDLPLALYGGTLHRTERRFAGELALWSAHRELHLVCIATAVLDQTGAATIVEPDLMLCSPEWIPVGDEHDLLLTTQLVQDGRCFTKVLAARHRPEIAPAAYLRESTKPVALIIDRRHAANLQSDPVAELDGPPAWVWRPAAEPLPPLPQARRPLAVLASAASSHRPDASCHVPESTP